MKDGTMSDALFDTFEILVDEGRIGRLGVAFARFIGALHLTPTPVLLACVLLAELEGRGHSCLSLQDLADDPHRMLDWSDAQWKVVQEAAGALPGTARGWSAILAPCTQVWVVGQTDGEQPLVLDQERLYLRRYWRHEMLVARTASERAIMGRGVDIVRARAWLERLFQVPAPLPHVTLSTDSGPNWQKIACALAVRSNLSIITGGPGTGKTYTVA